MATEIVLSSGMVAIVDDTDAVFVNQWKWSAAKIHGRKYVAKRTIKRSGATQQSVYMHRLLLGLEHGDPREADHINHDTLDNRRCNLRVVTPVANKRWQPSRGGSSSYVGVTFDAARGRWRAQIQIDGKVINLGRFDTEIEAAAARDAFVVSNSTGHELNLVAA